MNGVTYSALDLEKLLAQPQLFKDEWLNAYGNDSPGMAARFGMFADALPLLLILAQGNQPGLKLDASGNPINDEWKQASAASLYDQLLTGISTPGATTPDTMGYIRDILTAEKASMDDNGVPTYLQAALQIDPETQGYLSFEDQASNANALVNAAMMYANPTMRSMVSNVLGFMGKKYSQQMLDAYNPTGADTPRPMYTEWLRDNASNWGI